MIALVARLALSAQDLQGRIPPELVQRPQWVCWRLEQRDGKWTKPPINPHTGEYASTTNPTTWTTFENAVAYHLQTPESHGIGFVFTADDPFSGVDLDGAMNGDGSPFPWAAAIVERFPGAYVERSPSGRGLHLVAEETKPEDAMLTPDEAARMSGLTVEQFYRRKRFRPAIVRQGHRTLRVSERRLRRILEAMES